MHPRFWKDSKLKQAWPKLEVNVIRDDFEFGKMAVNPKVSGLNYENWPQVNPHDPIDHPPLIDRTFNTTTRVKDRKAAMGFQIGAGLCKRCRFFAWTKAGEVNRCLLGHFPCRSWHGCALHESSPQPVFSPTNNFGTKSSINPGRSG